MSGHTKAAEAWEEVADLAEKIAARHRAVAADPLEPPPMLLDAVVIASRSGAAAMLTANLAEEDVHDA